MEFGGKHTNLMLSSLQVLNTFSLKCDDTLSPMTTFTPSVRRAHGTISVWNHSLKMSLSNQPDGLRLYLVPSESPTTRTFPWSDIRRKVGATGRLLSPQTLLTWRFLKRKSPSPGIFHLHPFSLQHFSPLDCRNNTDPERRAGCPNRLARTRRCPRVLTVSGIRTCSDGCEN